MAVAGVCDAVLPGARNRDWQPTPLDSNNSVPTSQTRLFNLLFVTTHILPTRWAPGGFSNPHNRQSLCKLPSPWFGIDPWTAGLESYSLNSRRFDQIIPPGLLASRWLEWRLVRCYHGPVMRTDPPSTAEPSDLECHAESQVDASLGPPADAPRASVSLSTALSTALSALPVSTIEPVGDAIAVGPRGLGRAKAVRYRETFEPFERWLLVGVCLGIFTLFGVARVLTPNESGVGTHRALGFPPCGAIVAWGIPCPSCGMTTSWAWFVRGQFGRSWSSNPGGLMLAIFVLVMATWMGISGVMNRWWPVPCEPNFVLASGAVVVGVTLVQWLYRIWPSFA